MLRFQEDFSPKEDWIPFASCFSFLGAEKSFLSPERNSTGSDAPYLGNFLPGVPNDVGDLKTFAHPETMQKVQKKSIPRKTRRTPRNTLVLDLEGTSAVSSLMAAWDDASVSTVSFQGRCYQISLKLRPHIEEFLESVAPIYEVFIFTAAKQDYADKILEVLGPQRKLIRHRLCQEDCLCHQGCYIKDLSILERDLDSTVAVATCQQAFPYQSSNVTLIPKWLGDPQDTELLRLIPVLKKLSQAADVRTEIGNIIAV